MNLSKKLIVGVAVFTAALTLNGCASTPNEGGNSSTEEKPVLLADSVKTSSLPKFVVTDDYKAPKGWTVEASEDNGTVIFSNNECAINAGGYISGSLTAGKSDDYLSNMILNEMWNSQPGSDMVRTEASIPSNLGSLELVSASWNSDGKVAGSDDVVSPKMIAVATRAFDSPIDVVEDGKTDLKGIPVIEVTMNCSPEADEKASLKDFDTILKSLKVEGLERK